LFHVGTAGVRQGVQTELMRGSCDNRCAHLRPHRAAAPIAADGCLSRRLLVLSVLVAAQQRFRGARAAELLPSLVLPAVKPQRLALPAAIQCLTGTGGTCKHIDCFKERGETECINAKCMCSVGSCSDATGTCHAKKQNALVARSFKLRNVAYPEHFMYLNERASAAPQVMMTNNPDLYQNFSLYVLPTHAGNDAPAANNSAFLLHSDSFPDFVVAIQSSAQADDSGASPVLAVKISSATSAPSLAVKLCRAPAGSAGEMMIESAANHYTFFQVRDDSWNVFSHTGGPEDKALWVVDPPFDEALVGLLPVYDAEGRHSEWLRSLWKIAGLCVLGCVGLVCCWHIACRKAKRAGSPSRAVVLSSKSIELSRF